MRLVKYKNRNSLPNLIKNHKVLIFPATLLVLLIALTSLRLSGTSIGIYHSFLYGPNSKDSALIFGKPQLIRSDEWLVNTQITIAQEQVNYSRINPNFNNGEDVSLLLDAPYKDWSTLFKPQNISFFIMPLEYAFAFKWWFMLFVLAIGAYFFCLKMIPNKIWVAITVSIVATCSPFISWWYQTGTIAPLAYGFLILLVSMSLIDGRRITLFKKTLNNKLSYMLKTAGLIYLLSCFAIILYPPFQIPIAIIVLFFMVGYLMQTKNRHKYLALVPFVVAIAITGLVAGAYALERMPIINAVSNTVYPGQRRIVSGGYDKKSLLVTYLQPLLQFENKQTDYGSNQSESSSFILTPIFFLVPSIAFLLWLYIRTKKIEWTLLFITACSLLFLAFLFIPGIDPLARLFALNYVPQGRLLIGIGFIAIITVVYLLKLYQDHKLPITKRFVYYSILYSLAFLGLIVWAGLRVSLQYPNFISNKEQIIVLASTLTLASFLILINRPRTGIGIMALFSISSIIYVNPLYVGLGPIYNSNLTKAIQSISNKGDVWASAQNIVIENLPQISGRLAITGVASYPNVQFWKINSDPGQDFIYNRYAHIVMSSDDTSSLRLIGPDFFAVSSGCDRKINQSLNYIISATPLLGVCDNLIKTINYPDMSFYFYRVSHN